MKHVKVVPSPRHLLPEVKEEELLTSHRDRKIVPDKSIKGPLPPNPLHYLPEPKKHRTLIPG